VEEIRAALQKVKSDGAFREQLVNNGFENLKRFSPERIGQQYLDLYKKVLNNTTI
jgi:glycosyltransferase involved in cell wall biosynthesis